MASDPRGDVGAEGERPDDELLDDVVLPAYAGDPSILAWLDVLLKGKPYEQAAARTEIGLILEDLGYVDDAEEAYWTNVQARVSDRRPYDRLAYIYAERQDRLSESLVRQQAEEVFGPATLARPDVPEPAGTLPVDAARILAPDELQVSPPAPSPTAALPGQPVRRLRRLRNARRAPGDERPAAPTGRVGRRPAERPAGPSPRGRAPLPPAPPARNAIAGPTAAPQASAVASDAAGRDTPIPAPSRYRPDAIIDPPAESDPTVERVSYRRGRRMAAPRSGLIVFQPSAIGAFLLASFGAAALIAFLIIATDRGTSARPSPEPTAQLPARCADAAIRFPGAHEPRAAVVAAYREHGIDIEAPRAGGPRLASDSAAQVVGGWIGISLMLEHAGQPAPTLAQWLDPEADGPSLANAILAGRGIDSMLTAQEWAELRSWPATNCDGAFIRDPRNGALVRLVERAVARP